MNGIDIRSRTDGEVPTLSLQGELDISAAPDVERELWRLEQEKPSTLVLDLRGLRFIDSTGLRLVLAADQRARKEGRRLLVVPGPQAVHRVFRIALLDQRLEFVEEPEGGEPRGSVP